MTEVKQRNPWRLSAREYEVVKLICAGLSSAEIALRLRIGNRTLQTHVAHVMQKLDAYDRICIVLAVLYHSEARRACFPTLEIKDK